MALTCPRCGTDVPNEAMYCPYCSLPKPKHGFAAESEHHPEEVNQADQRNPRIAFKNSSEASNKSSKRSIARPGNPKIAFKNPGKASNKPSKASIARPGNPRPRLRVPILGVAALVALLSVGTYIFLVPMFYSEQAEPKTVLSALEKLRKSASNEEGLTIDARLSRELETARRVRNLTAYQGWVVRPIKGSKTKVVLAFSFQEAGEVDRSAEWLADLTNSTFTPQTDLAIAVSNRQSR